MNHATTIMKHSSIIKLCYDVSRKMISLGVARVVGVLLDKIHPFFPAVVKFASQKKQLECIVKNLPTTTNYGFSDY